MDDIFKSIRQDNLKREGQVISHASSLQSNEIEKGKALPVGTTRVHGGKKVIKTATGWRPVKAGSNAKVSTEAKEKSSEAEAKAAYKGDLTDDDQGKIAIKRISKKNRAILAQVDSMDRAAYNKEEDRMVSEGVNVIDIQKYHTYGMDIDSSVKESNESVPSKADLYKQTGLKPGSVDEFEDDEMRSQLTKEDVKAIVAAEREDGKVSSEKVVAAAIGKFEKFIKKKLSKKDSNDLKEAIKADYDGDDISQMTSQDVIEIADASGIPSKQVSSRSRKKYDKAVEAFNAPKGDGETDDQFYSRKVSQMSTVGDVMRSKNGIEKLGLSREGYFEVMDVMGKEVDKLREAKKKASNVKKSISILLGVDELSDTISKGGEEAEGTVKTWSNGKKYKKQGGEWVEVTGGK